MSPFTRFPCLSYDGMSCASLFLWPITDTHPNERACKTRGKFNSRPRHPLMSRFEGSSWTYVWQVVIFRRIKKAYKHFRDWVRLPIRQYGGSKQTKIQTHRNKDRHRHTDIQTHPHTHTHLNYMSELNLSRWCELSPSLVYISRSSISIIIQCPFSGH